MWRKEEGAKKKTTARYLPYVAREVSELTAADDRDASSSKIGLAPIEKMATTANQPWMRTKPITARKNNHLLDIMRPVLTGLIPPH